MGCNIVGSIGDYQRGQDHCVKHTAASYKAQKWNEKEGKNMLSIVIVGEIAPRCVLFIVVFR